MNCVGGMDYGVQRCKLKGHEIKQQENLLSDTRENEVLD